jgi:hypothetical protein
LVHLRALGERIVTLGREELVLHMTSDPKQHPGSPSSDTDSGARWLAWGWWLLLVVAALAVWLGWEDLRLALDLESLIG